MLESRSLNLAVLTAAHCLLDGVTDITAVVNATSLTRFSGYETVANVLSYYQHEGFNLNTMVVRAK
jgi:hypothetical protein